MRDGLLSRLFDGDGFSEVARLVHVAAAPDGDVVRQHLQRNDFEDRCEELRHGGNFDHMVGNFASDVIPFGDNGDHDREADRPKRGAGAGDASGRVASRVSAIASSAD